MSTENEKLRRKGRKPLKAMIFAAGLGTRLRPLTNDRPKAMVEVGGMPLLEIQIRRLKALGIREIVVNVHHFADMITGFLDSKDNFGVDIQVSDERGELLETGGGLKKAQSLLEGSGPFFVCNVDVLTDLDPWDLLAEHVAAGALATLAVRTRETSRYLLFDEANRLCGWQNVKTGEVRGNPPEKSRQLAFSGLHIIDPQLFAHMPQGAFSIIETYLEVMGKEKLMGYPHNAGIWLDVGKPPQLAQASALIGQLSL